MNFSDGIRKKKQKKTMADFTLQFDNSDQSKMEKIFAQLEAFDTNHTVRKGFQTAGNNIEAVGKRKVRQAILRTTGGSTPLWKRGKKYKFVDGGKMNRISDASVVAMTLYSRYSSKNNGMWERIGFSTKMSNGIGKLAHIFDRGTKERYTKKGYYRGHIFKTQSPSRGALGWTQTVETEGPKEMRTTITNALNKALTAITVKY